MKHLGLAIMLVQILCILPSSVASAKKEKTNTGEVIDVDERKTTALSVCKKEVPLKDGCKVVGKQKAEGMIASGFDCKGPRTSESFECNEYGIESYIFDLDKGVEFDHLSFTDLNGFESLIVYPGKNSDEICKADLESLKKIGIKKIQCNKRKENILKKNK